jgi:glycerol kinase
MVANDWIAQDMADILNVDVERPAFIETTALGAAMLAGVGTGLYASLADTASMRQSVERFEPQMDAATRDKRLDGWAAALARTL